MYQHSYEEDTPPTLRHLSTVLCSQDQMKGKSSRSVSHGGEKIQRNSGGGDSRQNPPMLPSCPILLAHILEPRKLPGFLRVSIIVPMEVRSLHSVYIYQASCCTPGTYTMFICPSYLRKAGEKTQYMFIVKILEIISCHLASVKKTSLTFPFSFPSFACMCVFLHVKFLSYSQLDIDYIMIIL